LLTVDRGVKPSLELDSNGYPQISYMLEAMDGFVKHAAWNPSTNQFDTATASVGYFYGPLDLALDQNNVPHMSYHDHTLTDQIHSYFMSGNWVNERVMSPGHDGWDNSILIDGNNQPHTSTIDPSIFGGVGVEYAYFDGSQWNVEAIGSGGIMYANATSLALDSRDRPNITYYDDRFTDLMYAVKDSGQWTIIAVDTDGDVGRYSSLQIDSADVLHVSYYHHLSESLGLIKYAVRDSTEWTITTLDTLRNVSLSFARNMTSLVLDSNGRPRIAYSDQSVLKYATFTGSSWVNDTVVIDSNLALGQLASLKLDVLDRPHIAYFAVTSFPPLDGNVMYATQNTTSDVRPGPTFPDGFSLSQNYPNPFNATTTFTFSLRSSIFANLTIYDLLGREVAPLVNEKLEAGTHARRWDATGQPSGVYFYRLTTPEYVETRKLVLLR